MTMLAGMLAAAQRLLNYYNGDEKTAQNPGGLTGVGGMADNWDPCIQDIGTVANGMGDVLVAIQAIEETTAGSAQAAAEDRQAVAQDKAAVHADREAAEGAAQATAADRQAVHSDAQATHQDRLVADEAAQATAADRQAVHSDAQAAHQDRLAADQDAQATAADRQAVASDRLAVAADAAAAHEDRLAADASAADAAAAAAGVSLPPITAADAGKPLIVKSDGTGYQVGSVASTVAQSPIVYMTSGGTTTLTGKSVLAAYEQIAGQTFTVDYNTRSSYAESDPLNGTALSGGMFTLAKTGGAPLDANTKLLVHFDGTDGSTTVIDECGHTITPLAASPRRLHIGTNLAKFGGASLRGETTGNAGGYAVVGTESLNLQGGFDLEAQVAALDFTTTMAILTKNGPTRSFSLYVNQDVGTVSFGFFPADGSPVVGVISTSAIALTSTGNFTHIRVSLSGTTLRLSLDGIVEATAEISGPITLTSTYPVTIGSNGAGDGTWRGNIDEVRISNIARSTDNFTPPTEPYGLQYAAGPAWVATKPGLTALDLSAFSSIDTVTCAYTMPPNTTLKFLISTDNYATALKKWSGSAWVSAGYGMAWSSGTGTLTTAATPTQLNAVANTFAELQAGLLAMDATALVGLNIMAILSTTNQQVTPSLDALNLGMDEYTMVRPVTDYTVKKKRASGDQTLTVTRVAAGNANMVFDYSPAA